MVTDESPPPLYSPNSEEITIQNGYSNSVACQDYWRSCPYVTEEGFTEAYCDWQWNSAVSRNPRIIAITSYGAGVEGGQIEARTDSSPDYLFEDVTHARVYSWKGQSGVSRRNAHFISRSVPPTMAAGHSYVVSIVMQNTGTYTWTRDQLFRLASQNPRNNSTWGLARVELGPGEFVL